MCILNNLHEVSWWIEHHSGLAAWVQAIGSLLAIAIAIVVPWSQTKRRARQEECIREQEVATLASILIAEILHGTEYLKEQINKIPKNLQQNIRLTPMPPSTKIYEANCNKLGLFNRDTANKILIYYDRIEGLRRFTGSGNHYNLSDFNDTVNKITNDANSAISLLKIYLQNDQQR